VRAGWQRQKAVPVGISIIIIGDILKNSIMRFIFTSLAGACLLGCASVKSAKPPAASQMSHEAFGQTADGTPVGLFTLRNSRGTVVKISNYGGIIVSFLAPDRNGAFGDVVLGYDNLAGYLKKSPYFGSIVGRYANRIAKGKFTLNGKQYTLANNNGPNALHGGLKGFDKVVWEPKILATRAGAALQLQYVSQDGEEGYPGTVTVKAVYSLDEENNLRLDLSATTDKETIINLSQHSYFNLAGRGDILNHEVTINADKFTPVDATLIPTGELRPVQDTPFDFRKPSSIGARIKQEDEQLRFGNGYDHNWIINKPTGQLALIATVYEPTSGRVLEVSSTEPAVQFYTGNHLDGTLKGKGGWVYQFRNGLCLEPQHYPDSPNHPEFPSVTLKPGEEYHNTIIYRLSVRKAADKS
jgi:aldose 1-epimerase